MAENYCLNPSASDTKGVTSVSSSMGKANTCTNGSDLARLTGGHRDHWRNWRHKRRFPAYILRVRAGST